MRILLGDARDQLRDLPDESVHCVATSPPFFGLRDYGTGRWEGGDPDCDHERPTTTMNVGFNERWGQGGGRSSVPAGGGQYAGVCPKCGAARIDSQIGLEATPDAWATSIVEVMREARRVLRPDGSLWVECGDSYNARWGSVRDRGRGGLSESTRSRSGPVTDGMKEKDLVGAPYLLAFALRADGWFWRGCYVWEKPDAMPESVRDRCTTSHSAILHFAKSRSYYFDRDAIREPFSDYSTGGDGGSYGANADAVRTTNGGPRGSTRYLRPRPQDDEGEHVQPTLDGDVPAPEVRGPDGRRALHLEAGPNSHQHRDGTRWPSLEGRSPRSVWRITTEASSFGLCPVCRTYWDSGAPARHCDADVVAHFAVWPHELVAKIVNAATPEAGCCAECGAPRARRTRSERTHDHTTTAAHGLGRRDVDGYGVRDGIRVSTEHLGWQATCECDAETVPCTVLDVFGGSGTTARQARRMGRRAILIELSPDYAEIATHRLSQQALPLLAG